jgi:hypothetical protein
MDRDMQPHELPFAAPPVAPVTSKSPSRAVQPDDQATANAAAQPNANKVRALHQVSLRGLRDRMASDKSPEWGPGCRWMCGYVRKRPRYVPDSKHLVVHALLSDADAHVSEPAVSRPA